MEKKKVLVVIQLFRRGGVELVALNYARNLDKSKYDITVYLQNPYDGNQDEELKQEVLNEGIKVIERPENVLGYLASYRYISKLIKQERYDIIHSHVIFFSGIVLAAAKKNGVPVRAAHSHIMKWNHRENIAYKLYKHTMRIILKHSANVKLACSQGAGEFLYGKAEYNKNGQFIPNGIDTSKYVFDSEVRRAKRAELGVDDDTVLVGHIGTIYEIKNQTFLVRIFDKMLKQNSNMKLLLVGEKKDSKPVEKIVSELALEDKVVMTGQRTDIPEILQALDIMIFPSLHEALPVSLIEAQATKLPCLIADTVTTEVKFNENVDFMSLSDSEVLWAEKAFELLQIDREAVCDDELVKIYDTKEVIKQLDNIYSNN